jgi:hypothetical protein
MGARSGGPSGADNGRFVHGRFTFQAVTRRKALGVANQIREARGSRVAGVTKYGASRI